MVTGGFQSLAFQLAFQQEGAADSDIGRRTKRRKYPRLYVEVDGQSFAVNSEAEAVDLLQRARAIAEQQSEQRVERVTKVLSRKAEVPQVSIPAPEIEVHPSIYEATKPIISDIRRLYSQAEQTAELRLLLKKQMDDEDDDDMLLLL